MASSAPISSRIETIPREMARVDALPIVRLRKMFETARSDTATARDKADKDRDYYDGEGQLESEIRTILKLRGQPPIYTNRCRPAIDGILGVLEAAESDPRGHPRTPQDENVADIASKTLRFISDSNRFKETKLDCAENFLIEGTCAVIIEGDLDNVPVTQIRHEEFFYDPTSRRPDFKDARYLGIAKYQYADDVARRWPERWQEMGDPTADVGLLESTWQDRPNAMGQWIDRATRRMMVVEMYYREGGQWLRCVFCASGVLDIAVSPYLDDKGRPCCPIEAVSCYVDRKNNRYGRIRDMVPIQDEINARRSRLLHLANSRQVQEAQLGSGAGTDADTVRMEAAKADGVIPTGWQMVPTADLAAGQQILLADSKSEIERMGPTPAVLGRQGESGQSGRARLVLQQAGMTELARPLGRFEDWERRCYGQMWARSRQFWQAPKWIRTTDDTNAPKYLQVNEPVMGIVPTPMIDPEGNPVANELGQPVMVPTQGIVGYKNRLAEMDLDIIVDTVPDTANLAQEIWQDLLTLAQTVPIGSPQFMIALEMSPLPDKQRIIERIKAWMQKQAQQQADPMAEQMGQLQLEQGAAKVERDRAAAAKDEAAAARTMFDMGFRAGGTPGATMEEPTTG